MKHNNVDLLIASIFLLFKLSINAQPSFSSRLTLPSLLNSARVQQVQASTDINYVLYSGGPNYPDSSTIYLSSYDNSGSFFNGYAIETDKDMYGWRTIVDYKNNENIHAFNIVGNVLLPLADTSINHSGFFYLDLVNDIFWGKETTDRIQSHVSTILNEKVATSRNFDPTTPVLNHSLGVSCFEQLTGNSSWEHHYRISQENFQYRPKAMTTKNNDHIVILGTISQSTSTSFNFLLELSDQGIPVKSISFPVNYELTDIKVMDNDIIIVGNIEGTSKGFIVKLNNNLQQLWYRELISSAYNYNIIKAFPLATGSIRFIASDSDDIPVISGTFTEGGDLVDTTGYAFTFADYDVLPNGTIVALSPNSFNADGLQSIPILTRTTQDGVIIDCPIFNACVSVEEPQEITLDTLEWFFVSAPPLQTIEVNLTAITLNSSPYCGLPLPPTPDFLMPDTICQFNCISPINLNNQYANTVEWYLDGPLGDTITTALQPEWCFDVPGNYFIEHRIWTLGCLLTASTNFVVLEDNLRITFPKDTMACDFPLQVKAQANRPLQSVAWDHGPTTPATTLSQAGNYSLYASDGFCSTTDTIEVFSLESVYPFSQLQVKDTVICSIDVPYTLSPTSPYTSNFSLDGVSFNNTINLSSPGSYHLSVMLDHCMIDTTFVLEINDCSDHIYLPTAFSPNQDGRNDRLFPQGVNIEIQSMAIFDRWGSLLFKQQSDQPSWNGMFQGQPAQQGTYIVIVDYIDTHDLKHRYLAQAVVLLR